MAPHCDPRLDAGRIGLRTGPITAASDLLEIRLSGPGGHTARPQLTAGTLARIAAGHAPNAIPASGRLRGTVRMLYPTIREGAGHLVGQVAEASAATSGAIVEVDYRHGVPPVVNDPRVVEFIRAGVHSTLGTEAAVPEEVSMGGEDFAWYQRTVPGAMARLGVRRPGGADVDLHRGSFAVDDRLMVGTARAALAGSA